MVKSKMQLFSMEPSYGAERSDQAYTRFVKDRSRPGHKCSGPHVEMEKGHVISLASHPCSRPMAEERAIENDVASKVDP
ncbi:Os07g0640600 [Oryza sativa Japonica Group]|uniref:Os07g0640600 protein n=1 Tax=Oryza sativa subsp. japonica TaxID=39947 RepID=A0A0P0X995_ORYSJ|nr:hypothetical protein EE612_040936 [Oryza sativa]BAT02856.1 Os07g0640600 [Oryza sativa Japonica Group]